MSSAMDEWQQMKRMTPVPLEPEAVRQYLDGCITLWREKRRRGDMDAPYYIDAFQSVRISLLGEVLPQPEPPGGAR